jgi:spore germination protein YaaH
MTPKQKAEQIYIYMNLSFNAAESAICLLHQHCEDKAYWEEVWEALLDTYGCRWQQIEFEHQRQHYIQACTL